MLGVLGKGRWFPAQADLSFGRFDQFFRVVAQSIFEYHLAFLDVLNIRWGVSMNQDDVGHFPDRERTDLIQFAKQLRAVRRGDANRF